MKCQAICRGGVRCRNEATWRTRHSYLGHFYIYCGVHSRKERYFKLIKIFKGLKFSGVTSTAETFVKPEPDGDCAEHDWETVGVPQGVYQCKRCGQIG